MIKKAKISVSVADLPINISPERLFAFGKKLGIDGVEVVLGYKSFPPHIKLVKLSQKFGVPILSLHQPQSFFKHLVSDDEMFLTASSLQVPVVIHPLKSTAIDSPAQKKYLRDLAKKSQKYRVRLLLEKMSESSTLPLYRYQKSDPSTTKIDMIVKSSNTYNFGVTLDTSHLKQPSPHKIVGFMKIMPSIENIHLSDFTNKEQHLPLGSGVLQSNDFLTFLKMHQYQGLITLELSPHLFISQKEYFSWIEGSITLVKKILT